jgi:hypothetical protein
MKAVRFILTGAAAAGLVATAKAQPPLNSMAPPPPLPTGIAPYPPPPYVPTIWDKLGVSKAQREYCRRGLCKTPFGAAMNTIVSPFNKLSCGLIPKFCPDTPSLAELQDPGPIGAAAKVKQDRAGAEERIKAVKYLAAVDCHYWPEAEEALINALRNDRNEAVRYEAAVALANGCCCTPKVVIALSNTVGCSTSDGGFLETSAQVRRAAEAALERCMPCCAGGDLPVLEFEKKGTGEKGKGEQPKDDKNSKLPAGEDPNAELKAYYAKAGKLPKAEVMNYARKALEIGRQMGYKVEAPSNPMDLAAAGMPATAKVGIAPRRPTNLLDLLSGQEPQTPSIAAAPPVRAGTVITTSAVPRSYVATVTQTAEPPPVRKAPPAVVATRTPAPMTYSTSIPTSAMDSIPARMPVTTGSPYPAAARVPTGGPSPTTLTSFAQPLPVEMKVFEPLKPVEKKAPAPEPTKPAEKKTSVPEMVVFTPMPAEKKSAPEPVKPVPAEKKVATANAMKPAAAPTVTVTDPVKPGEKKVMVMEPVKSAEKKVEKKPMVVEPVKVPAADQPAGVARVVVPAPLPASVEPAPAAKPAPPSLMMAEPVSVRPAIPARQ